MIQHYDLRCLIFIKPIYIFLLFCLVSCQSSDYTTLSELKYDSSVDKEREAEFEKITYEDVRQEYRELSELFEDEKLTENIQRRISDVYMMEGVSNFKSESERSSYYADAIESYKSLLDRYPNSPENAEVYYQLAKAYDLEGQPLKALEMLTELVSRHPNYENIVEVYFRKADIHFNYQEYDQAKSSYLKVVSSENQKLNLNAHYMLAWVYYKEESFLNSIDSFAFVLSNLFVDTVEVENLSNTEKPLAEDSIHSLSLALDKLGGAEIIQSIDSIKSESYVWMIYDELGEYYLEKELYERSADAYRHYVSEYAKSKKAPYMHDKLISSYQQGGFPLLALQEKETYIIYYGIYSNYWSDISEMDAGVKGKLNEYLDEVARFNYSEGQIAKKEYDDKQKKKSNSIVSKNQYVASYQKAAFYFGEYIETFPGDDKIDDMRFLKAEAHFLAGEYLEAADNYQLVAYQPVNKGREHAANSGYAAIISYQKYIDEVLIDGSKKTSKKVNEYREKAVETMLLFAKKFDNDKRSPSVLTNAADYLFGLEKYQEAINMVDGLFEDNKQLDAQLKKTAYNIKAHSYFELSQYISANENYHEQRKLVKADSEEYDAISEKIAITLFKYSEQLAENEGEEAAAYALLRIKSESPNSKIRVTAQYDAASTFLTLSLWKKAIDELEELRQLYPNHQLSVEFPRKLAFAYEEDKNYEKAVYYYETLYRDDPDTGVKREALFSAGTMYEELGQTHTAIKRFKSYAHRYEEPFDTRMEARYRLAVNYTKIKDTERHLYWLRRIIAAEQAAGLNNTERSRWLSAWANLKYGDYYTVEFNQHRLRHPLVKYLTKKQELFEQASKFYQKSSEYGFLDLLTESTFKLAILHDSFAESFRTSSRPPGLNKEEQELYKTIIEEQAQPLENLAIQIHQTNIQRAWDGEFTEWIDKSYIEMKRLFPERYGKQEAIVTYGEGVR